jgi:predicted anti-sigma-YlaC factor YlaD
MTHCWPEGALRAYLDRELSAGEIQQAAAHVKECAACRELCRELEARAARVGELMELLPAVEVETVQVPARMPRRAAAGWRVGWVGAAVAVAAALGVVAYLVPAREKVPVPVAVVPAATAPPAVEEAPAVVSGIERPAAVRASRRAAQMVRTRTVAAASDFVALDDEPFESGVIVRVAVTPGKTQADIVFGPDGRARAFRLVEASKQKY